MKINDKPLQSMHTCGNIDNRARRAENIPLWFAEYLKERRRALILELGTIEDLLNIDRSIKPSRKR
jgi:hypothetical protein